MNNTRKIILTFSLIFVFNGLLYAQVDPYQLLKAVSNRLKSINSYSVDILIRVEVDMVKINDRKAKMIYQKPNKFKFESEGFLLLPKRGIEMDYVKLLESNINAIYIRDEIINRVKTHMVKVIPLDSESDVVLAEMWIDPKTSVIMRINTYTKESGSYLIDFTYANHPFNLPDLMIVEFDVKGSKIPKKLSSEIGSKEKEVLHEDTKGKVIVFYSNYRVSAK